MIDIYKVIWSKHEQGGIVYKFTDEAYEMFRTLDFVVTQTMNEAWESGEADFSVSKDINYFLRYSPFCPKKRKKVRKNRISRNPWPKPYTVSQFIRFPNLAFFRFFLC